MRATWRCLAAIAPAVATRRRRSRSKSAARPAPTIATRAARHPLAIGVRKSSYGLALNLPRAERSLDGAAGRLAEARNRLQDVLAFEERNDQQIGIDLGRRIRQERNRLC